MIANHLKREDTPLNLSTHFDAALTSKIKQERIRHEKENSTEIAIDFAARASYNVRVKTGGSSKHSGTNSSAVFMRMYGPNGNSNSFRYDDPDGRNDFEKNETNNMRLTSSKGSVGGNIGAPFALEVWIDTSKSHDGWELEWIEVTYTTGSHSETRRFTFNGWFTVAGDRGVGHKDRWGAVLWADNTHTVPSSTIKEELSDAWVVIDNRHSTIEATYTSTLNFSYSSSSFFSRRHLQSTELHYSFSFSKTGGIFGADYEFSLEKTFKKEEETVDAQELIFTESTSYPINVTAPPGQLLFRRMRILGEVKASQSKKINHDVIDILPTDLKKGMAINEDTAIETKTFGQNEDISEDLKHLYEMVLGKPFVK